MANVSDSFLRYVENNGHTHHCFERDRQSLLQQSDIFDTFIRNLIGEDAIDKLMRTIHCQNNNLTV
jgi:hypothetical protein